MVTAPERRQEPDAATRVRDAEVERLAREFGEAMENVPDGERETLRDYAIELLRDEGESARQERLERTAGRRAGPFGVFGLALLLLVAGGMLLVVLTPVGVVLLLLAVPVAAWGVAETLFTRRPRDDTPVE